MKIFFALIILIAFYLPAQAQSAHSIFVPRPLSYQPILENALVLNQKITTDFDWIFSCKPIYTQSVGDKFEKYFNIFHKSCLNVQENGSGDIGSLWFEVESASPTMFSSTLSFSTIRRTYGSLFYFAIKLPCDFQISINTALVNSTHNMHICEKNINNLGIVTGFANITQSFANNNKQFGKICGSRSKIGLDDIQIKLMKTYRNTDRLYVDAYALLGIPTGAGSKAHYLFEPLVGSRHLQLGLGTDVRINAWSYGCGSLVFLGELKWRYGFGAKECRSFDLKDNGQWSRYLLFVPQADKNAIFPAINDLTLKAQVTPQNSLDIYLAAHTNYNAWNFELGYNFWYRNAEKISLNNCNTFPNNVGIADLPGIAKLNPQSASTATIAQGVQPGPNQIKSDATFVPVALKDINLCSGAQPRNFSNSVYGSIAYEGAIHCHPTNYGLNASYEQGNGTNTPNNVSVWFNFDFYF
jgi:hypothetical protein